MHASQLKLKGSKGENVLPGTPRPKCQSPCSIGRESKPTQRISGAPSRGGDASSQEDGHPEFFIWVKNEPFDFGLVSPHPCPKMGINVLRKIADYCREKASHFPRLSLSQWLHIGKNKIQIPGDLVLAYFRVFDIVSRPAHLWSTESNDKKSTDGQPNVDDSLDGKFYRILKQGNDAPEPFTVDTQEFLVFLYIQLFLRLHKKYVASTYASNEPWPKLSLLSKSGDDLGERSSLRGNGSIPEHQHAEFLLTNLSSLIDLLNILLAPVEDDVVLGKPKKGKHVNSKDEANARVACSIIKALSFILGATSGSQEFTSLDKCLGMEGVALLLDYQVTSQTVDKQRFVAWVTANLQINPWGPFTIPVAQVPLSVTSGVWEETEDHKRNKLYFNSQAYPKAWFLISGVEKQVILLDSLEPMSSIKIHRCVDAYIYIPGVHNVVLIRKCHGITINVGVVTRVVKVVDSSNVNVTGVGRFFLISDVTQSSFSILTPSSPIINGNKNHEIRFSPYNTALHTYPNLSKHMKMAGLSTKFQKWNKPLEIGSNGLPAEFCSYMCIQPEDFRIHLFPFKTSDGGLADPIPGILPNAYQKRVENEKKLMDEVRDEFYGKIVSKEDANLVIQSSLQRFKKWLKDTGNFDHIVGLRSFQKCLEQKTSEPVICTKGYDLACVSRSVKSFFDYNSIMSARDKPLEESQQQVNDHRVRRPKGRERTPRPFSRRSRPVPILETNKSSGGGDDKDKKHKVEDTCFCTQSIESLLKKNYCDN